MSKRDGVADAYYDLLRGTGLTREQCWAILECFRSTAKAPSKAVHAANLTASGVRAGKPRSGSPPEANGPAAGPADDPGS